MESHPNSRLFYRKSPEEVVVQHNGREIARYRSKEELVEVHMKGIMAIDPQTRAKVLEIYRGEPGDN